jgi:nucleoside-diphosphate-sugar epimerase
MRKISILGCGWLGLPLAKSLVLKGYSVCGSTTSEAKISALRNQEIIPFQIQLFEDKVEGEMDLFLENSEIVIIDIPPKLRGNSKENFVQKIRNLIPFLDKSTVEKVLFISSTSVYADDNSILTEKSILNPDAESGRQLLEAEQLLESNSNFKTTIVRFGGLIGDDRHPIYFLAGKKNLENPDSPINLIHQEDCIGVIEAIIESECWQETFNAVYPSHPTRKEYYTKKAIDLHLPLPEFDQSKPSIGKTILSDKLEKLLNYKFNKNVDEL